MRLSGIRAWTATVLVRRELVYAYLGMAIATIFLFRYLLLLQVPYPPSGDAGGDLYLAHAWSGHRIEALSPLLETPPLYVYAIVFPFTTLFPTLEGIQLYMAFVPALLVAPAYLLVRESGAGRWPAAFGATILALATIWSLMVTWNAAYNLFGIGFLLLFLVALIRYLRTPGLRPAALVATTFVLVGLSHPLTFLVAAAILVVGATDVLLRRRLQGLREAALLVLLPASAALPLAVFYVPLELHATTSGGGGSYTNVLYWALQSSPYFAWGYQGSTFRILALVDISASVAAIAALARDGPGRPFFVGMTGVLSAAVLVALLDPANAVRALYFLPIPFVAPIPRLLEGLGRNGVPSIAPWAPTPMVRRWLAEPTGAGLRAPAIIGVALILLIANADVSASVMSDGIRFNEALEPNAVATMDWIRTSTPTNATFFDGGGLQSWMWGYAQRMDYAPTPASTQVTESSQAAALLSDEIDMGTYLLSGPEWVVSSSFPSPIGTPQIYIATPGYWEPFLGSQADYDSFEVMTPNGTVQLGLTGAQLVNETQSQIGSVLTDRIVLGWPSTPVRVVLTDRLDGGNLELAFGAIGGTVRSVAYSFGMPPSGYFFEYAQVPTVSNVTSLVDRFAMGNERFSLTMTGGNFSQSARSNGWEQLYFYGNGPISLNSSGMSPQNSRPPAAINTTNLIAQLGVDHAIVNLNHDYSLYCRLQSGAFWGPRSILEFQSGPLVVYGR